MTVSEFFFAQVCESRRRGWIRQCLTVAFVILIVLVLVFPVEIERRLAEYSQSMAMYAIFGVLVIPSVLKMWERHPLTKIACPKCSQKMMMHVVQHWKMPSDVPRACDGCGYDFTQRFEQGG